MSPGTVAASWAGVRARATPRSSSRAQPLCRSGSASGLSTRTARVGYVTCRQPPGLNTRSVDAGYRARRSAGRIGRRTSSPPQFGQCPASRPSAQTRQKVHSNEQIIASADAGGNSRPQHSQLGLSWSTVPPHRMRLGRRERVIERLGSALREGVTPPRPGGAARPWTTRSDGQCSAAPVLRSCRPKSSSHAPGRWMGTGCRSGRRSSLRSVSPAAGWGKADAAD